MNTGNLTSNLTIERQASIICGILVREILHAETFADMQAVADAIFQVRLQAKQIANERDLIANSATQCQTQAGIGSGFTAYGRQ